MTDRPEDDRPAVTGTPIAGNEAHKEAVTGDDDGGAVGGADSYPADGVSPDRGSSAPRD